MISDNQASSGHVTNGGVGSVNGDVSIMLLGRGTDRGNDDDDGDDPPEEHSSKLPRR